MKKVITFFAVASIFAACSSKSDLDTQKDVVITDTTNMYKSNASTDINTSQQLNETPAVQQAPQPARTIIRERTVYIDRTPKASKQVYHEATPVEPVVTAPQPQSNTGSNTQSTGASSDAGVGTASTGGIGTGTDGGTSTPEIAKKKGWSNAAKDAVIGGVGGAVAGAVISKKKGTGAVIGGIIGAAGGYILGRKKDKSLEDDYANN
jgi:hypothetical protein